MNNLPGGSSHAYVVAQMLSKRSMSLL